MSWFDGIEAHRLSAVIACYLEDGYIFPNGISDEVDQKRISDTRVCYIIYFDAYLKPRYRKSFDAVLEKYLPEKYRIRVIELRYLRNI